MAPFDGTILDCLTQEQLTALSPHLQLMTCNKGQVILLRGEVLSRFYVLVTGRATAQYTFKRGRPIVELSVGDFFGETALLEETACDAFVRAADDGTAVLGIDLTALRGLLGGCQPLRERLLAEVAERRKNLGCAVLGVS